MNSLNTCVEDNCTCPSASAAGCGTAGSSGCSSMGAQAPSTLQCVRCQLTHWGSVPAGTFAGSHLQGSRLCVKSTTAKMLCHWAANQATHCSWQQQALVVKLPALKGTGRKKGGPQANHPGVKYSPPPHTHPTHACWWQAVEPHVCTCSVSCATAKRTYLLSAPVPAHSGVPTALRGTDAGVLKCPVCEHAAAHQVWVTKIKMHERPCQC